MMSMRPPRSARVTVWLPLWGLLIGLGAATFPATAGQMYRWVDEQGRIHLTDTPPGPQSQVQDFKAYAPGGSSSQAEQRSTLGIEAGRARLIATKPGGTAVVEAVVNRRLTVPLMLDTGADLTVLTMQMAKALQLQGLERLPTLSFSTPGGLVNLPITTLTSLRVGTAEVRNVDAAIDLAGHLPVGLLGMSFLRHFTVTVDHQRNQITFAR